MYKVSYKVSYAHVIPLHMLFHPGCSIQGSPSMTPIKALEVRIQALTNCSLRVAD